jgi:hypothetical protein
MLNINWRSPAAYAHTRSIPAVGFAWEYLRRNDEYQRDVRIIGLAAPPRTDQQERFEKRWGTTFSKRPRRIR